MYLTEIKEKWQQWRNTKEDTDYLNEDGKRIDVRRIRGRTDKATQVKKREK